MILRRKHLNAKLARLFTEIIIEDNLPIHIEVGRSSKGETDVLFSFAPEDEPVYEKLINETLEVLYGPYSL
jgi:hypothetical protein